MRRKDREVTDINEIPKGAFGEGPVHVHLRRQALPVFVAELVHVLYNIVDRIFLGRIPSMGVLALSGVGIVFPLITLINAFAGLFGTGGAPLCAIARGEGNDEKARRILSTSFTAMIITGAVLSLALFFSMDVLLPVLGATSETLPVAEEYLAVYLAGTVFVMISLGMNPFINMQGNSITGMMTVVIGAALNCVLDPLFIFVLGLGVRGAAMATVISQFCSALWVFLFLTRKKTAIRLTSLSLDASVLSRVFRLGISGFMFKATNSLTQAVCNVVLKLYAGPMGTLYIGAMSLVNSVREITMLPASSVATSMQPIVGYNYGAKKYSRCRRTIALAGFLALLINTMLWLVLEFRPTLVAGIFTQDEQLLNLSSKAIKIYFASLFCMAGQVTGQNTFVSFNCPKRAVFFSLFRKVILILPLTIILPVFFGTDGVFIAEAISQFLGGTACFTTMYFTVFRKLKRTPDGENLVV